MRPFSSGVSAGYSGQVNAQSMNVLMVFGMICHGPWLPRSFIGKGIQLPHANSWSSVFG